MTDDDAPLANPQQPGAIPNDQPSGLPDENAPEPPPLGATDSDPDGEGERARGERAMPGFPTDGEPQSDG